MGKIARTMGKISGIASTVLAFVPGMQPIAAAFAINSAIMTAIGGSGSKPKAKGQINERIIGANNPTPWMIGRTYSGGVQLHDVGYGGTVSGTENPYRFLPVAYSLGPIDSFESIQLDYTAVTFSGNAATGYFAGFLYRDAQLGALPEADALAAQWSSPPNWGSDYKLSGLAAVGYSMKFDKKGKVFAGGDPIIGIIAKQVAYDPRLDSTQPGGSGSQRKDDWLTWTFSENPALYSGVYAHGIYQNGKKIFGVDLGSTSVNWADVIAWANLCDANGWKVGGTIYEPADKWNNLKRIAQAGGGVPVLRGGVLGFRWHAVRVSLDTIAADDLVEGDLSAGSNRPWAERFNTKRPRFRSEAHQWNYTQTAKVKVDAFVTEDGEEKADEPQYDLVQDGDQAVQLATYEIYDGREAGPFVVTVKPRLIEYRPGDALTLDASCGLWPTDLLVIIQRRRVDPATGTVELELVGETSAKHAAALGSTATVSPAPPYYGGEDYDNVIGGNTVPPGYIESLIINSYVSGAGGSPLSATDAGTDATIAIAAHDRVYSDKSVSLSAGSLTGLPYSTDYWVYYDDPDRSGGAVTYVALDPSVDDPADAFNSPANPGRHNVGYITTPASGGGGTGGGGAGPPGSGGGGLPLP